MLEDNQEKRRLALHAFVIMPDHFHLLLTPAADVSLEKAMQFIKGGLSFRLKSKGDVWEKSFTEHRIKDRTDYRNHLQHIEQNPVRKKLCLKAGDYPHSSASFCSWLCPVPVHLASAGAEAPYAPTPQSQG